MTFNEIEKILEEIPAFLNNLDDDNFSETMKILDLHGKKVKIFRNEHLNEVSEEDRNYFLNKTKLIREKFDNVINEKRAKMHDISLDIRRLSSKEKVINYRSSI